MGMETDGKGYNYSKEIKITNTIQTKQETGECPFCSHPDHLERSCVSCNCYLGSIGNFLGFPRDRLLSETYLG